MKKQQKKRADNQMVIANRDARQKQKNRKQKALHSDETPLLISQALSSTSLCGEFKMTSLWCWKDRKSSHVLLLTLFWPLLPLDQVEHAHDNPLDEITLGECDATETMMLDEIPAGRKLNLETDEEPGVKSEGEDDPQVEAKKTKIKQGKKEKSKGERNADLKT